MIAAWNTPPEDGTWYDAVIEFLHTANPDHLPATTMDWPATLAAHPRYEGLRELAARHEQPTDRAAFRRLLGTHSAINVLPPGRRDGLIDQALAVAEAQRAFDDHGNGAIPWRCELFVLRRSLALRAIPRATLCLSRKQRCP